VDRPEALVERAQTREPGTMLPIAPLMHGATQWSVMGGAFQGNKVVLVAKFDPQNVWRLVGEERVNSIMITGDAMGRPLVEALDAPGADYDLTSLVNLSSTAAVFSPAVKDRLLERLPSIIVSEAIGASETGSNGYTLVQAGQTEARGPRVTAILDTVVLDDDMVPIEPGSGAVGKLARAGNIPVEYYKDPEKSAQTFVTAPDGTRYSMPGDFATVEADGRIVLLGRGAVSINSGGEKIYPEEVEAAIKSHPDVYDCTVVGVPDERWGQRVVAVVQTRDGATIDLDSIQQHCRGQLAGYKVPRDLHLVPSIVRSPSGKPDYRWAKDVATGAASPV
jgi:acyl-CoA synthetase (AMP-forming)/AMP-acid ligase II